MASTKDIHASLLVRHKHHQVVVLFRHCVVVAVSQVDEVDERRGEERCNEGHHHEHREHLYRVRRGTSTRGGERGVRRGERNTPR